MGGIGPTTGIGTMDGTGTTGIGTTHGSIIGIAMFGAVAGITAGIVPGIPAMLTGTGIQAMDTAMLQGIGTP